MNRRAHEPHGDAMIRWDDIEPAWLREGAKFYTGLQVESGQITWSTVFQSHVYAARLGGFAVSRGLNGPALASDPSQLRATTLVGAALTALYFLTLLIFVPWGRLNAVATAVTIGGGLIFGTGLVLSVYRERLLALPDRIKRREGVFRVLGWR